ncbi:DUF551 domain-containing protein [Klebsiella pneumoniae]|nr:DUF551 domain-containing protein [Klebsiella pneumoniae]
MTKSTITRERIELIANFHRAMTLPPSHDEIEELARMALAAMDSEPVVFTDERNLHRIAMGRETALIWSKQNQEEGDIPLYRHAPPCSTEVVMKDHEIRELVNQLRDIAIEYHGTQQLRERIARAVRAAMLAAAPQLTGSELATVPGKWIPVSEQLPEDSGRYWCYVEEQNDLGKSHYQWNCSWNGDRWWVESEGGGVVTHWMPLPAGPQEVR